MIAREKRIYILMIKVTNSFPFFHRGVFLKNLKTCSPCFYRVTETLVKLEKAVETLAYTSHTHSISLSPKRPLVFL